METGVRSLVLHDTLVDFWVFACEILLFRIKKFKLFKRFVYYYVFKRPFTNLVD